ncbi:hypothetical protein [Parafrankia discariae]|uniref:hypothetical protein n=1 Tax=Parafrankia discariae TaxID=365528 RepID=UPI0003628F11|nr:hypothetical protein [Parafrankia discariae]
MPNTPAIQRDIILATANLVGRTGARGFEVGHLDDDPTNPRWWASAEYKSARIIADDHPTPEAAAEGLARRLLTGARCRCGRLTALSPDGAVAVDATMADGTRWTVEQARQAGQCLWVRDGPQWNPSCPPPAGRGAGRG